MSNLVEIDRSKVISMNGTPYVKLADTLRREYNPGPGDVVIFLRAPDSTETIIRIIKPQEKSLSNSSPSSETDKAGTI